MNTYQNIALSKLLIKKAIREFGPNKICVASSGGKDSMVISELYYQCLNDLNLIGEGIILHSDTKIQPKGTVEFIKKYCEIKNFRLEITEPLISFGKVIRRYGLPEIRNTNTHNHNEPKCCELLKTKPADLRYKELGIKCIIIGLTKEESHNRRMFLGRCGDYYFAKTKNRTQVYPIANYSIDDIWKCHEIYNIPIHPFYKECPGHRLGCLPCTSYIDWKINMPTESIKWYNVISKKVSK